ncbi:MAG TPA: hypothetical protein DD706_23230 [Nitrospiraceae bacterium]|nr:hypothetical protein [Nitrospiraceae bacterium]
MLKRKDPSTAKHRGRIHQDESLIQIETIADTFLMRKSSNPAILCNKRTNLRCVILNPPIASLMK